MMRKRTGGMRRVKAGDVHCAAGDAAGDASGRCGARLKSDDRAGERRLSAVLMKARGD